MNRLIASRARRHGPPHPSLPTRPRVALSSRPRSTHPASRSMRWTSQVQTHRHMSAGSDAQLAQHTLRMPSDGVGADLQLVRNRGVGVPPAEEVSDADLLRSKAEAPPEKRLREWLGARRVQRDQQRFSWAKQVTSDNASAEPVGRTPGPDRLLPSGARDCFPNCAVAPIRVLTC